LNNKAGVIVVGVDHTRGSRAALEFALQEGVARGTTVEIVTAWQWISPYEGIEHAGTVDSAKQAAAEMQDAVVQEALDRLTVHPAISQIVVHDYPGKVLAARAEDAAMLVVGSGRKGAVTRTLMGSVSEYCVRHAPAPVVVVPDPDRVEHPRPAEVDRPASAGVKF
jgi:nucleotide-binding universal stress UspA family protein